MTEENQEVIEEIKEELQENAKPKENDEERNFANMRKKLQEKDSILAERERQLEALQKQMEELSKSKEKEEEYADDDYAPLKAVRKDAAKIAEQKIREYEDKNWKRIVKTDYPDFDEVASVENMQQLEQEMPEIAQLIMKAGNKTDMAIATYKAIKRMKKINSIDKEISENKKALEKNKDKPMSTASVDKRPIAQVARYSDEDYQELWKETQMYASRA